MTHPTTGIILIATLLLVLVNVAVAADTVAITARQAVVRAGPGSKQAILTTVPQGTAFALLETRQGWHRVLLDDGREGWVAQSAARVEAERGFVLTPAVAATAPGRTALVIGNAAYSEDLGPLKNPGNDATDMAATLRQLGFAVTLVPDATHQRMAEAVEDFSRQLRPGSVGVFYYAGHGAQVGGRNYLIPLGARITTEAVVPYQAVAAEEVLAHMDAAGQGKSLNVMILDACRNAPFMRGWRSPLRGLASMQATGGSLITYATAPGAVAADGTGRNGTYTRHLLRFMTEPNLPVELMFKQVRLAVEQETKGQQIPWESSSLRANFYFNAVAGGPTPVTTVETPQRPVQPGASDGQALLAAERQRQEDERRRQEQLKVQAEQERVRLADQERQRREEDEKRAQTTPVVVGTPPPLTPPVDDCVELPPSLRRGNVVFPTVEDIKAWFACNPGANCVEECIEWVSGQSSAHGRSAKARQNQDESARVRELTRQGIHGRYAALEGASKMPAVRQGEAVFCEKGTHYYWRLMVSGKVRTGLY